MSLQVSDGSSYEWGLRGGESNASFLQGSHRHPGIISRSFQSIYRSHGSEKKDFSILHLQGDQRGAGEIVWCMVASALKPLALLADSQ